MRPKYLRLHAIGPFGKDAEIDFEKFGMKGLVLFTGETGAGKTFIFDAITYALFGKTNGNRDANSLQSDFSDRRDESFVEMRFVHDGKEYYVRRQPECYVARKRSGASGDDVKKPASVEFHEKGRPVLSKTKEVDARIAEILGIGYDQWKHISMIAQGEFRKLISANSKERAEVLRRIFDTGSVQRFQQNIKERYESAEKDNKAASDNAVASMNKMVLDEELKAKAERFGFKFEYIAEILDILTEQNAKDVASIEVHTLTASEFTNEKERIISEITAAKTVNDNIGRYNENKTKLAVLKARIPDMKKMEEDNAIIEKVIAEIAPIKSSLGEKTDYIDGKMKQHDSLESVINTCSLNIERLNGIVNAAELEFKKTSDIDSRLGVLKNQANEYDDLEKLSKELARAKSDVDNLTRTSEALAKKKIDLDNKIREYRKYLDENKGADGKLEKTKSEIKSLSEKLDRISDVKKQIDDYKIKCSVLENEEKKLATLMEARNEIVTSYENALKGYLSEQSGILAEKLEEGCPCPVCGSKDHPSPARKNPNGISQKDVDELSKKSSEATEKLLTFRSDVASKRSVVETMRASIEKEFGSVNGTTVPFEDIEPKWDELNVLTMEKFRVCTKDLDEYSKITNRMDSIGKEFKQIDEEAEKIKVMSEEVNERLTTSKDVMNVLESTIKERKRTLAYQSKDELDSEICRLTAESQKLRADLDKATTDLSNEKQSLESNKGQFNAISKDIESTKSQIEQKKNELKSKLDDLKITDEEADRMIDRKNDLVKMREEVNRFNSELAATERIVEDLEKLVEGKTETNVESLEARKKELEERLSTIDKKKMEISNRAGINAQVASELRIYKTKTAEQRAKLDMLSPLYDVALGKNHTKMTFETYVQKIYFELVLEYANDRLSKMTGGRYELRSNMNASGNAIAGLDIDVLDNFTGKTRSSDTLSGGESFMTALSLALGLSDVVQEMSGGIKIDTLFVDEGFGSLDPNALAKAIEVLNTLSGGEKLVGVISHVEALEENIEKKVIVTKSARGGSTVALDY